MNIEPGAYAKTKVNAACKTCHPISEMTLQILLRRSVLESIKLQRAQWKPLITLYLYAIMASPKIIFCDHDKP